MYRLPVPLVIMLLFFSQVRHTISEQGSINSSLVVLLVMKCSNQVPVQTETDPKWPTPTSAPHIT